MVLHNNARVSHADQAFPSFLLFSDSDVLLTVKLNRYSYRTYSRPFHGTAVSPSSRCGYSLSSLNDTGKTKEREAAGKKALGIGDWGSERKRSASKPLQYRYRLANRKAELAVKGYNDVEN